ncbi:MAG: hypothetical protein LBN93_03550 [Candidatus Symbiothrix sp.]|jgi:hypothetical protein|nr:hypothetical protein [Candidatus Symbiothrix sp.]
MSILQGLLYINNTDVYQQYGAFLSEDKAGDHTNYSALLKPATMKPYVAVSFREENGEKLPTTLTPKSEARDVTLQFAIIAASASVFMQKYTSFMQFLKSGWLNVNVPETGKTFKMYCASCSDYDQLTPIEGNAVAAKFKVKFREPNPTF